MLKNLFLHWPIPASLPPVIDEECRKLRSAKSQEEALFQAYDIVTRRFQARHWKTYIYFWRFFDRNLASIWMNRGHFRHCTHLNWLVKVLACGSGWFKESDITEHWTMQHTVCVHQYLTARLNDGRIIDIDPWGRSYGIPFGDHASGTKSTAFPHWVE